MLSVGEPAVDQRSSWRSAALVGNHNRREQALRRDQAGPVRDGKWLRHARRMLDLSQAELAEALGWCGAQHVSNVETGARPLQQQTALAVECLLRRAYLWR